MSWGQIRLMSWDSLTQCTIVSLVVEGGSTMHVAIVPSLSVMSISYESCTSLSMDVLVTGLRIT